MLSSRLQRRVVLGLMALAVTSFATDAFALRNRYTNEPTEGFAALFFEAFGRSGLPDERPIDRRYRRPLRHTPVSRNDLSVY